MTDPTSMPPVREVEEILGRAASLMDPAPDSPLEAEMRALLGVNYNAVLAKGRFEAVLAMLAEPAVLARIDEMAVLRRRASAVRTERRRRQRLEAEHGDG